MPHAGSCGAAQNRSSLWLNVMLVPRGGQAVAVVFILFLTAASSFGLDIGVQRKIDIGMLLDFSNETLNQMCEIANVTEWQQGIINDIMLHNTSYQIGHFTVVRTYDKWHNGLETQGLISSLNHAIIFWGSDANLKQSGIIANFQHVPVISLPRHGWYREGAKLPNVVVARTGQSLKGIAALDLVKPPDGGSIEVAAVIREDKHSSEVEVFLQAKRGTSGVHVVDFVLSEKSLELITTLDTEATSVIPDSLIVDSNLDLFFHLVVQGIKEGVILGQTIVIFLHQFDDVQTWRGLSMLAQITPYIFSFRQRVPSSSFRSNISFSDAVAVDALEGIARAAISSNFNPYSRDLQPVSLPNSSDAVFNFSYLTDGPQLTNAVKQVCVHGLSGSLGFSTGGAINESCLDRKLVEFDIMQLNRTNFNQSGPCTYNWYEYGQWTGTQGLQVPEELWRLSVITQEKAEIVKVLLVPFDPFVYVNETGKWAGVDWDLLNLITAGGRVGFAMSQVQVTQWNGSRDGAVLELGRSGGVSYDLVIGAIISDASTDKITYTRTYYTLHMGLVTLKNGQDSNIMWRFMQPFHWSVWLAVAGVIVAAGLVSKWLGLTQSYVDGIWVSCCTIFFVQENRLVQMRNPFGRVFIIALSVFVLILISAYTANMVSFLSPTDQIQSTLDPSSSPLVTIDKEPYKWLQSSGFYNVTTVSTWEDAVRLLRQGKVTGVVADLPLLRQTVLKAGPSCDLSFYNYQFPKQQYAFAISQQFHSKFGHRIGQEIADAISQNAVEESYLHHMKHDVTAPCWKESDSGISYSTDRASTDSSEESLGVNSFVGVALVVICAAVLCLVAKGLRTLHTKFKSSKVHISVRSDQTEQKHTFAF